MPLTRQLPCGLYVDTTNYTDTTTYIWLTDVNNNHFSVGTVSLHNSEPWINAGIQSHDPDGLAIYYGEQPPNPTGQPRFGTTTFCLSAYNCDANSDHTFTFLIAQPTNG